MDKQPQRPFYRDVTQAYWAGSGRLDPAKRAELIVTYAPLIKYIATRLAQRLPAHIAVDDLVSSGIIGLIDAIDKFDLSKNVQFKTYAEFRIKGAMLDELRALDWVPRSVRRKITELEKQYGALEKELGRPATDEEMAKAMDINLDEFHRLLDETKAVSFLDIELVREKGAAVANDELFDFFAQVDKDPYSAINLAEMRALVAKAIDELPEKERLVISLYYYEELTMKEIGGIMSYTESRICQLHSKAVFRLRAKVKRALGS